MESWLFLKIIKIKIEPQEANHDVHKIFFFIEWNDRNDLAYHVQFIFTLSGLVENVV
jgi:hypothetical protein